MTQLALELSQLEVEPIELQEVGITILQREQNRNLETLTTTEGKNDVLAILTLTGTLPVNADCGGGCGSCSCGVCRACVISCSCIIHCVTNCVSSCVNCGSCK
jgi:hypothetical protein